MLTDDEPEYDQEARGKLAAAGLTSDEEDQGQDQQGGSGYDPDSNQADAGQRPGGDSGDAELAAAGASKKDKHQKGRDKRSRSRSKSREKSVKASPWLKKRAREPGQPLRMLYLFFCCAKPGRTMQSIVLTAC